jgi:hypothetical protein
MGSPGRTSPPPNDDRHDPSLPNQLALFIPIKNSRHETALELIQLSTRIPEPSDLQNNSLPNAKSGSTRKPEKPYSASRKILAHLAWAQIKPRSAQFIMKFLVNQMNLPEIDLGWIPLYARTVLDGTSHMSVALDAQPRKQANAFHSLFAERVAKTPRHAGDDTLHA